MLLRQFLWYGLLPFQQGRERFPRKQKVRSNQSVLLLSFAGRWREDVSLWQLWRVAVRVVRLLLQAKESTINYMWIILYLHIGILYLYFLIWWMENSFFVSSRRALPRLSYTRTVEGCRSNGAHCNPMIFTRVKYLQNLFPCPLREVVSQGDYILVTPEGFGHWANQTHPNLAPNLWLD